MIFPVKLHLFCKRSVYLFLYLKYISLNVINEGKKL